MVMVNVVTSPFILLSPNADTHFYALELAS